jgi:hypothetical protein
LHILDRYAQQCCPVLDVFAQSYHWSFMQVEYAADLVFRSPAILKPLYEQLSRQAILLLNAEAALRGRDTLRSWCRATTSALQPFRR